MRKALIVVMVLLIPGVALGDLVIKEKVSSKGGMGMWSSEGTEVTYIKNDMIRTDSKTKMTGMMEAMMPKSETEQSYIVRLDEGLIYTLNLDDSTYTEMGIEEIGDTGTDVESKMDVKEVKLEKTGETKKIAGYKCEGIVVTAEIGVESEGGVMDMDARLLFWAAKEDKKLKELKKLWESMMEMMDVQEKSGLGAGMKVLWDKFNEIEGVPLGMELYVDSPQAEEGEEADEMRHAMEMMKQYMKDMAKEEGAEEEGEEGDEHFMVITREVISIEEASHKKDLFEIPKGFTKR